MLFPACNRSFCSRSSLTMLRHRETRAADVDLKQIDVHYGPLARNDGELSVDLADT